MNITKTLILLLSLALTIPFIGCSRATGSKELDLSPEDARRELGKMNVQYTETAFIDSAKNGDILSVKLFLAAGMNPNVNDPLSRLAYVYEKPVGFDWVVSGLEIGRMQDTMHEIRNGVANYPDGFGRSKLGMTALMAAAINGRTEVVRLLLAKGAAVDARDGVDMTALVYAAWKGHNDTVVALVEKGANVNTNANTLVTDGTSPLIAAASAGNIVTVNLLLDKGADVNAEGHVGSGWGKAIKVAAINGHASVVRALVNRGADVNAKDFLKRTALMDAAMKGHIEIVLFLMQHNADINAKDDQGETALKLAKKERHTEIVQMLKQAGAR